MLNDFDRYLTEIKNEYEEQVKRADFAYTQLEEWNKDEEIQKLKAEKKWIYNHSLCTNLSDKEVQDIKHFQDAHYITCGKIHYWQFNIGNVGFGHTIEITCPICGKSEDITDTNNW